jgi:hypothetical protein
MRSMGTRNRPKPAQDRVRNEIMQLYQLLLIRSLCNVNLVFCDAVDDFRFARLITCEQDHEEPSEEGKHGQDVDGERGAHGQGVGKAAVTEKRGQNARETDGSNNTRV